MATDEQFAATDPVRLGARIRATRTDQGMSQAELAGGALSVGHLSHIERGTRRPSLSTIAAIAERLRVPVARLLDPDIEDEYGAIQQAIDWTELSLQNGSVVDAERSAGDALSRAVSSRYPDLARRARFLVARAMESRCEFDSAIDHYQALIAEGVGTDLLEAGIALVRCLRDTGDTVAAADTGQELLARARTTGLGSTDAAYRLASTTGMAYTVRGDLATARRFFAALAEDADRNGTPQSRAAVYWNQSVNLAAMGAIAEAVELAERAVALMGEGDDPRLTIMARHHLAVHLLHLPEPDVSAALDQLGTAADAAKSAGMHEAAVAQLSTDIMRAHCIAGHHDDVVSLARDFVPRYRTVLPQYAAEASGYLGRSLAHLGSHELARDACREALECLASLEGDLSPALARSWIEIADTLESLGETADAMRAYKRAAELSGAAPWAAAPRASRRTIVNG